ncbi:thiopeptide-type bacteriocin biosynthesis protein [Pedobacter aquatilis]|uniref:lantibiotic dehydratase n=1 Tax=Pedobacter aquatilis TaxID=351343 RepID=UPI0025B5023D|nr:lantibiotic dehydratase [Pedobacter aquatilis]MDN3585120.1 thiopeptide-type bacteriocin biosynthesis protein [Pedobacter aquatilis]
MKLKIHPNIIFRTPKFSYLSNLEDCWDELKTAISISSSSFYETIKDVKSEEIHTLPPKIFFTIWKYFNRSKFRSTPYGTFAGFSIFKDGFNNATQNQIIVEEEQIVHEFLDWPEKNKIQFSISRLIESNSLLFANSSYYFTSNSIRYIACSDGLFELAEIDKDDFVYKILQECKKPIHFSQLLIKLEVDQENREDVISLLEDMLSLQLLFCEADANIIGQDYFQRIGYGINSESPKYLIAERNVKGGGLNADLFNAVPGLVNLMQRILPIDSKDALVNFINKFRIKFEQKEIPLSLALDPEMGVGYDELEQAGHDDDFVTQFRGKRLIKNDDWRKKIKGELQDFISAEKFQSGKVIQLEKLGIPLDEKPAPIPNSFSMLLTLVDDLICVDQTGGSTANALSGRFTLASDKVLEHCKAIGKIEESANPDIIFFDVAYMVETNVDNINRRKLVYNKQLSILNFDTSADPLTLDDIMLSVQGSEIFLRSKSLNKRLVPRMASAYNYSRSDLSVFRLLCDLQHQNVQTNLTLFLENLFPELSYYPRIQYQNIVLAQQKWQVSKADFKSLNINESRDFLKKIGVNRYFRCGLSDQTLCFDLHSDADLFAFESYMQKQDKVYLEEVLLPEFSAIIDESSKPYLAQFILNLYHDDNVYRGFSNDKVILETDVKQFFPPGKEWLYFEIYCHQQRSDALLLGPIAHFVEQYQAYIKKWFFIRYNENGYHIRFRILLNDEKESYLLASAFSEYLDADISSGLISDLQIKTYKRETQRYGNDIIEAVETHFNTDSNFVLSLLESQPDALSKYKYCADLVEVIQKSAVFEDNNFVEIIKLMSDSFNEEHNLDPTDFKKLNNQYQTYRKTEFQSLSDEQLASFNYFAASFVAILNSVNLSRRGQLFSDLLHMHVNRLFNKEQRTQEMIIYYFLLKDVQRRKAMSK